MAHVCRTSSFRRCLISIENCDLGMGRAFRARICNCRGSRGIALKLPTPTVPPPTLRDLVAYLHHCMLPQLPNLASLPPLARMHNYRHLPPSFPENWNFIGTLMLLSPSCLFLVSLFPFVSFFVFLAGSSQFRILFSTGMHHADVMRLLHRKLIWGGRQ